MHVTFILIGALLFKDTKWHLFIQNFRRLVYFFLFFIYIYFGIASFPFPSSMYQICIQKTKLEQTFIATIWCLDSMTLETYEISAVNITCINFFSRLLGRPTFENNFGPVALLFFLSLIQKLIATLNIGCYSRRFYQNKMSRRRCRTLDRPT